MDSDEFDKMDIDKVRKKIVLLKNEIDNFEVEKYMKDNFENHQKEWDKMSTEFKTLLFPGGFNDFRNNLRSGKLSNYEKMKINLSNLQYNLKVREKTDNEKKTNEIINEMLINIEKSLQNINLKIKEKNVIDIEKINNIFNKINNFSKNIINSEFENINKLIEMKSIEKRLKENTKLIDDEEMFFYEDYFENNDCEDFLENTPENIELLDRHLELYFSNIE